MIRNIYDDGLVIDQRVKTYMGGHPGTTYRQALTALVHEDQAAERGARAEFDRRVEHEVNAGYDYDLAAEKVLRRDPQVMSYGYAESTGQSAISDRAGEVMAAAKKASSAAGISMSDAVLRILQDEPDVARKLAGDFLDNKAMTAINNENLGSSISEAFPVALKIVMRTYPEVRQTYETGRMSMISMRTIFWAWFKD